MTLENLVISLLSLMVVSIAAAVFFNERHKRELEFRQKLTRLRHRSDHIKEIALATEALVDDVNIPIHLLFQASALAKQIKDLCNGMDAHAEATLHSNLDLLTRWESEGLNPAMQLIASSNVEVDRYKSQLFEADRILQVSAQNGLLNKATYQQLHDELAWSTLAIDARAHIKQGDEATASRDFFTAQAHYRHARNHLEASHYKDPRCLNLINEAKTKLDALDALEKS